MSLTERAQAAWAALSGLDGFDDRTVFVDDASPLCPRGWIGILAIGSGVIASVPRPELVEAVRGAIGDLPSDEATKSDVVLRRLPPMAEVMGPAALFYADPGLRGPVTRADVIGAADLDAFFAAVSPDDLAESGLAHLTSPAYGVRAPTGECVAACGYTHWANGVAHLGVLTHPDHRRSGRGTAVAAAAIQHAQAEGLLPQWRARPQASQALARKLGLTEVGAQLSLRPT